MNASEIILTPAMFREAFPEFEDTNIYPDALLQRYITTAGLYVSKYKYWLKEDVQLLALEYMTAHLITLFNPSQGDQTSVGGTTAGGNVLSASVGQVSVSMQAPIASDAYAQWIQSTAYGKALWALLAAHIPAGMWFPGNPRPWGIR